MSRIDPSFDNLRLAIQSLWPPDELQHVALKPVPHMLLLTLPSDVAAFSVFNGHPAEEFDEAYRGFKSLYREHSQEWDKRTLSFVICRSSEHPEDDRFYASLEHDPLFCRKYVIRAQENVPALRDELLRLPFLPLRSRGEGSLQRPQSAQDLLQNAGLSASLSRKLIETGHRSAERIALELRDGTESLPIELASTQSGPLALTQPRAHSRLLSLTVEGFRAYREAQTFDLDASVVVLYGPNGLGKTSVFDAIDYASTGRIGRLCNRHRRSQTEFSRIATHLDKTPGSGSVSVTIGQGSSLSTIAESKLQRNTGNWTTAWLNGEEVDRKAVIGLLTQANWLDSAPRQQALESLFRATHLFGQGEQELLTEFSNSSVIPEQFVSEMLALQDYSQGLSKVAEVLSQLAALIAGTDQELEQAREASNQLVASLPSTPGTSDSGNSTPVEAAIAEIRKIVRRKKLLEELPPEEVALGPFSEWQEMVSAKLASVGESIQLALTVRDELPTSRRLAEQISLSQQQLTVIDLEGANCSKEEREVNQRIEANVAAIGEAEIALSKGEGRRRDLRLVSEAQVERDDILKQSLQLQAERDRQAIDLSEADSLLRERESSISQLLARHSEAERALTAVRTELRQVQALLDELPQFTLDSTIAVSSAARLDQTQTALRDLQQSVAQATSDLRAAGDDLKASLPAYERALAEQVDLERLLDSIEAYIHEKACPLCGSEFSSVEDLLAQVRGRRSAVSATSDVTARYKSLQLIEAQASDRLRVATAAVTAAKASIEELNSLRAAAERRIALFRVRIDAVGVDVSKVELLQQVLMARRGVIQEREVTAGQNAQSIDRELKALQEAQEKEAERRRALHERVIELGRRLKEHSDRVSALEVRIAQIVPDDRKRRFDLAREIAESDRSVQETIKTIEQLQSARRVEMANRDSVTGRQRAISGRREGVVAELREMHASITVFRNKLRALERPDDADLADVDRVLQERQGHAETLRDLYEKGSVVLNALQSRDARLQLQEKQLQLDNLRAQIAKLEEQRRGLRHGHSICGAIEKLLKKERQASIERHLAAYGPMITTIQQRLRSVYGFGGIQLEARGGEARVNVEWRNKNVQVPPTDFFSDSQKQILMLSIFLAGGLRQNWSGFAPMLLDDPVTHFDDLNAYGFVELLRGIISTSPNHWQFIISTCEERLFSLMQKKFARLDSGAIFYEFLGLSDRGPIIERR